MSHFTLRASRSTNGKDFRRRVQRRLGQAPDRMLRVAQALVRDPLETLSYVPEMLARRTDRQAVYEVEEQWGEPFHRMLGLPWPCPESEAFDQLWAQIELELRGQGLSFGRYTYGPYSDADTGFGATCWCACWGPTGRRATW